MLTDEDRKRIDEVRPSLKHNWVEILNLMFCWIYFFNFIYLNEHNLIYQIAIFSITVVTSVGTIISRKKKKKSIFKDYFNLRKSNLLIKICLFLTFFIILIEIQLLANWWNSFFSPASLIIYLLLITFYLFIYTNFQEQLKFKNANAYSLKINPLLIAINDNEVEQINKIIYSNEGLYSIESFWKFLSNDYSNSTSVNSEKRMQWIKTLNELDTSTLSQLKLWCTEKINHKVKIPNIFAWINLFLSLTALLFGSAAINSWKKFFSTAFSLNENFVAWYILIVSALVILILFTTNASYHYDDRTVNYILSLVDEIEQKK